MDVSDSQVVSLQFLLWKMVQLQIKIFLVLLLYLEKIMSDLCSPISIHKHKLAVIIYFWRGGRWGIHISLAAILEGVHISLVICVQGYTYHGGTHITATPPFWMNFCCLSFADFKNTVCLCVARCGARLRLPVAQFDFWEPGISSSQIWPPRSKESSNSQNNVNRKAATRIEILSRKSKKWMYSLRTVPVP